MFENPIAPFNNRHVLEEYSTNKRQFLKHYNTALNCFKSAWIKGILFRLLAKVLQRRPYLYDLHNIKSELNLHGSHYSGVKAVPIGSIIGTEGKASDFDMRFYPRSETSRERWMNVAMEYLCCYSLPPVELTQVGDAYFVRDGHHRISVARAFGQTSIDAEVVTWNASPPFPWQPHAVAENPQVLQRVNSSV